jgi:hypothetical protein
MTDETKAPPPPEKPARHPESGKRGLDFLREEVPLHLISPLPKETPDQKAERTQNTKMGTRCQVCGGWHHKDTIHLSYVGHAAATDRLLEADLSWNWEPLAFTPEGLPKFDANGGLWIKLTVAGQTRLGYGNADSKKNPGDREKEIIGDAIRNAAMRFGLALDLWSKVDLHAPDPHDETDEDEQRRLQAAAGEGTQERTPAPPPPPKPGTQKRAEKPYPAADFDRNFKAWHEAMQAGLKTAEETIALIEKRGVLSDEQKKKIRDAAPKDTTKD